MPLSEIQKRILGLLTQNRHSGSHLAGASAIHASPDSNRYSGDLDLFHDNEQAVAEAYARDTQLLKESGFTIDTKLSQPGFIRALVSDQTGAVLIDWAYDSAWRFMAPVVVEGMGHVLHPVDLAINKVLALAGREEARDWVDILYLDQNLISLGALVWAAVGKDPGLNPSMLLELLSRKGRVFQRDLDRLDLNIKVDLDALHQQWRHSLKDAKAFVNARPGNEAGHLYVDPVSNLFFTPREGDIYHLHAPSHEGIMPQIEEKLDKSLVSSSESQKKLEEFFGRKVLK